MKCSHVDRCTREAIDAGFCIVHHPERVARWQTFQGPADTVSLEQEMANIAELKLWTAELHGLICQWECSISLELAGVLRECIEEARHHMLTLHSLMNVSGEQVPDPQ
jgi:hypothetical protein